MRSSRRKFRFEGLKTIQGNKTDDSEETVEDLRFLDALQHQ